MALVRQLPLTYQIVKKIIGITIGRSLAGEPAGMPVGRVRIGLIAPAPARLEDGAGHRRCRTRYLTRRYGLLRDNIAASETAALAADD